MLMVAERRRVAIFLYASFTIYQSKQLFLQIGIFSNSCFFVTKIFLYTSALQTNDQKRYSNITRYVEKAKNIANLRNNKKCRRWPKWQLRDKLGCVCSPGFDGQLSHGLATLALCPRHHLAPATDGVSKPKKSEPKSSEAPTSRALSGARAFNGSETIFEEYLKFVDIT